jgi:hypothetical protein
LQNAGFKTQATVRAHGEKTAGRTTLRGGLKGPRRNRTTLPKPGGLWICGQFAFGEPGGLPWKTLRVSHRAPLCPQAPQTVHHFYIFFKNRTYKAQRAAKGYLSKKHSFFLVRF